MPDNGNFLPLGQLLLPCNTRQQQQLAHSHTDSHVPLADRSLNKITFKFNCKCILSVGFLPLPLLWPLLLLPTPHRCKLQSCCTFFFALLLRHRHRQQVRDQDRVAGLDAGLLQSNVIIFAIYTFSCHCRCRCRCLYFCRMLPAWQQQVA